MRQSGLKFGEVERSVVRDKNFFYTVISYAASIAVFLNLSSAQSPLVGLLASVLFLVVNTVFLGNAFFKNESMFFRLTLGALLLVLLIGFVGWLTLIIYNLDAIRVTLALLAVTTLASLLNRRMKPKNASK